MFSPSLSYRLWTLCCPWTLRLQAGRMAGVQAMAADPALSLYVVGDSMRALVARLADPAALPEFPKLQVRGGIECLCPAAMWRGSWPGGLS